MNKDKVYVQGYVVGFSADAMGYKGLRIQLPNMDIVEIDENLVYRNIDEQQKPVVPQFVADWYEEHKDNLEYNICDWIRYTHEEEKIQNRQFTEWLGGSENDPVETLIKMKLFGYEVKKEKRYYVRLKGVVDNLRLLRHNSPTNTWTIGSEEQCFNVSRAHTRKELEEAGFGEVFNSPLFEVEEVE